MQRLITWVMVALMALCFAISASAEELNSPQDDRLPAGYEGSFYIQTKDGKNKLTFGGRLQPEVYFSKVKESPSEWSFKVRRARLYFGATIAEKGHVDVTLMYSTSSAKYKYVNIDNATAGWAFAPYLTIQAGTVGIPLSMSVSSLGYNLIESPIVLSQDDQATPLTTLRSSFSSPDGLGIEFTGKVGRFYYDASIVNGATAPVQQRVVKDIDGNNYTAVPASGGVESNYDLNFNKHVSGGFRVTYDVLAASNTGAMFDVSDSPDPKLTLSLGGNYQGKRTDPVNMAQIDYILSASFGTSFKWRGLALSGEIFGRRIKVADPGTAQFLEPKMDDAGYYLEANYFVIPKTLSFGVEASQIFREGPHNDSYEFGGGINYHISETFKLQLAYTLTSVYESITSVAPVKTHFIGTMFTAAF